MKQCILCKKEQKFARRYHYGYLCSKCKKTLPNLFGFRRLSEEQLITLNERKKVSFSETSAFGLFHLDEYHGTFYIRNKRNLFNLLDMKEVALEPTNIRAVDRSTNLFCDVMLTFTTNNGLHWKGVIKYKERCNVKVDVIKNTVTADEPITVTLMRSMLNNAIAEQYKDGKAILEKMAFLEELRKETEGLKEFYVARGVLMLPEGFTQEQLKTHRNILIKALHPDNNSDKVSTEMSFMINDAYKVLHKK